MTGIEPAYSVWKTEALPLSYIRECTFGEDGDHRATAEPTVTNWPRPMPAPCPGLAVGCGHPWLWCVRSKAEERGRGSATSTDENAAMFVPARGDRGEHAGMGH